MKQKPYTIHFVCRGNTYRSRLAEAYMAKIVDDRFHVSSSGIGTQRSSLQTSEQYTKAIAKRHGLKAGIDSRKTQTTNQLLGGSDVIVFMNKDVYDEASVRFQFDSRKTVVWPIADIPVAMRAEYDAQGHDVRIVMDTAERTFRRIKEHCDELYAYVTKTSWVDLVDAHNKPQHMRLPTNWASDRGLWHRGVHVVVQTVDGKYVVGKRAEAIIFAPGMLEISLGGAIDSGEHPLHAAQRETHEELGVNIPQGDFRPLFLYRQVGYHPHYHKLTRTHLYVYAVTLPVHSSRLRAQPGEVAELRVLTKRQVKNLLRSHRVKHFGRLKWGYRLYDKAVAYASLSA